jgi:hypothetical protein
MGAFLVLENGDHAKARGAVPMTFLFFIVPGCSWFRWRSRPSFISAAMHRNAERSSSGLLPQPIPRTGAVVRAEAVASTSDWHKGGSWYYKTSYKTPAASQKFARYFNAKREGRRLSWDGKSI